MLPLSASEIEAAKPELSSRQKAAAVMPAMSGAKAVSRILIANTKPGMRQSIPNVRLGIGVVTSVVMTNQKGAIWPIKSYIIGDAQDFTVNWDQKSGILMLQSKKPYINTNLVVMLQNRATPVTVMLQSTQSSWDYEDYIRVDDGTDSENVKAMHQPYLLGLLSGVAPEGAQSVQISPSDVKTQVWSYQNHYLILTSSTLISPAYINHLEDNTMGKTNVYEIDKTPVIMLSDQTKMQEIHIKGS
ncbi:DotH/IcmK family type IV secretion protein [Facilibium subflavum]|uniref:DotH/IcmK family type IV secretion protein n=1 Tax=Facilibium subflavum TaxID=2219058 RepID=UPI000E64E426|nr:DotH/IcmK family type IV secretion protein [Facilibium subflavum]